ncbi:hypothetical protein P7L53_17545 [Thermoleptolyngbya sichuanensis XZ-Cy5]|uniref:hypothetical protein n=1 Tax=Thermoleptolyngbya sichuanensis TaxID=2885951 RepID=UPI00240E996D|nr:hypothetical protein [Thermoleptolyngbya sichuanensis]MDG2618047.1 hypothetical protein [Thermoleptolyngbya sichuanensis XZ-Cy5]
MTDDFITTDQDQVSHTDLTNAAEMLAKLTATTTDKPQMPSAAESDEKPSKTRRAYRKPVIVDLNLLKAVAEQIGIKGKNRSSEDLLHQVLEIFLVLGVDPAEAVEAHAQSAQLASEPVNSAEETAESSPATVDLKIVADQAKTLAWFTNEIETLKNQVKQLEQALQQGQTQPNAQLAALQQENQRLRQERDAAVEKLEAFRKLLNGSSTPALSTPALSTPALSAEVEIIPPAVPTVSLAEPEPTPVVSKKAASRASSTRGKKAIAPTAKPSTTKPTAAKPSAIKPKPAPEDASLDPGVLEALYAIMDYNNAQTSHADKWAISFPVMKDLCKTIGVATQTKITQVFRAKADLIEQHHQEHSLGQRHNRVHKGQSITNVISLGV